MKYFKVSSIKLHSIRFLAPSVCLSMVLMRSPVVRYVAQLGGALLPRMQHVFKYVVAGVSVGAYNTVTGASGDLAYVAGADDTSVFVGDQLSIVLRVEGKGNEPKSYQVTGVLPPGVTSALNSNLGLITISGVPTVAGSYSVTVEGWRKTNKRGAKTNTFSITFVILSKGPEFTKHPISQTVDWGGNVDLTVGLADSSGATFQWQKQDPENLGSYVNLLNQTSTNFLLDGITSADAGRYRVVSLRNGVLEISNAANILVNSTPYQVWREDNYSDPFSVDASFNTDTDGDGLQNGLEFVFNLNPKEMQTAALYSVDRETINGELYLSYKFPSILPNDVSHVGVEVNDQPGKIGWAALDIGSEGLLIESLEDGFYIKLPASASKFWRIVVRDTAIQ